MFFFNVIVGSLTLYTCMINVTAKPFRMIASRNYEKLSQELITCFV